MKKLLYIILIIFSFNIFAQNLAHDFSETDIYGNSYNLYQELNLGKSVVIDFFGVT